MSHSPGRQLEAVIRGSDRHLARCLIRRGRYIIGHDPKNEIMVEDDSISSVHARLTVVSDDEIYVEDLDSANGTFVDGIPVTERVRVGYESHIQLGQTTMEFYRSGLPAAVFPHLPHGFLRHQRYDLGDPVVQGRTSTIFGAHDYWLSRDVALRAMLPESQSAIPQIVRFVREAQITAQLQHQAITPVYELSVDESNRLYYTTRFVEGETLAAALDAIRDGDASARERFTLSVLVGIMQRVCDAVRFAHSRGVVHAALRPEAVMVGDCGEVFVTTWAFARILPLPEDEEGQPIGRLRVHAPDAQMDPELSSYSAPEQATSSFEQIGERTDVYGLGAILYRVLMLTDAFSGGADDVLLEAILTGSVIPPRPAARPNCPHWPGGRMPEPLADLAMRALSVQREDRPQNVAEFQRVLTAWQEGLATGDHGKIWKGVSGLLGKP
jgi:serine/threonine-protein kinase